jgi:transcriptional regulator with XRE-family HTH domain
MSSEPGTKSHDPGPWTSGDLARRLRDRRHALGLTLEDVAARAEMDPGFVELLERRPTILTGGALIRLADTLHTTAPAEVEAWAGGERDQYVAVTPERVSGRRIHV